MPNFAAGVENLPSFVAIGAMALYQGKKRLAGRCSPRWSRNVGPS